MARAFALTTRALAADRPQGGRVAILVISLASIAWVAWMVLARVPIHETSVQGRLEVLPPPSQVDTPIAGRIRTALLDVGRTVAAGDVLLELESDVPRAQLERARHQLAALGPELVALEKEIEADATGVSAGDVAGRAAIREQLAKVRAAEAEIDHAAAELARLEKLGQAGVSSTAEVDAARAELARKRSARETLGHSADALVAAERERDAGRRARASELQRQKAVIEGSLAAARAEVARLELEVAQHTVRAPVAGELGAVARVQPGAMVAIGTRIATVVPQGTLRVVAEYPPRSIGRLAVGQAATVKLDGFPWTRYGTVAASVTRVASEVRDGTIRVELALAPGATLPLVHGMTGTVEIEVEAMSPMALVLRSLVDRTPGAP
ncbi:MAG: HlyD family efflux transporter periplasmic adaptor subunit [Myxococcales bacterium]|nr:HlyD family efflux transporter periplasmic adaptor subunit [Myxococcales bacterium]